MLVVAVPGPRRAWLVARPVPASSAPSSSSYIEFLLPVVAQYLQSALEVEHAANELAERYEEINLLYTISEILGRTVSLEEAAKTILTRCRETVGARRASILVARSRDRHAARRRRARRRRAPTCRRSRVDDPCSVSARVFRTQHPMLAEGDEMLCGRGGELSPRRDALRADHVDRAARGSRAARRREPLRPALGAAVHARATRSSSPRSRRRSARRSRTRGSCARRSSSSGSRTRCSSRTTCR